MNPSAGEPRVLTGPARRVLGLLGAVQALAFLDRAVVAAVVEDLRADLWLTDTRLGALLTAVVLVEVLASLALGDVAGRRSRPALLAAGLALWGAATMASGLARSFAALLAARVAAGAGQATHAAVSPGLAADLAPARRDRVRALLLAAVPIGCAAGYAAGGLVGGTLGWRAAFVAAGAPVLVAALLCLRLPDAPHAAGARPLAGGARGVVATARRLLAHRPYALAVAGHLALTFAVAGAAFWMPAFLARARGVPRSVAAVQLGAVVLMTAFAGTFAGGLAADALRRRVREADLWVAGGAATAAAPLALAALAAHRPAVYLVALVAALLLLFASGAAARAAVAGAAPASERAAAAALSVLAVQLLGEAPAPTLLGALSDLSSLGRAVLAVPAAALAAGAIWAWAAWRGERGARARDQDRARSAAS